MGCEDPQKFVADVFGCQWKSGPGLRINGTGRGGYTYIKFYWDPILDPGSARDAEALLAKLLSGFGIDRREQDPILASFLRPTVWGTEIFNPAGLIIKIDRPDVDIYADDDPWAPHH
jgi:hypothetical protein